MITPDLEDTLVLAVAKNLWDRGGSTRAKVSAGVSACLGVPQQQAMRAIDRLLAQRLLYLDSSCSVIVTEGGKTALCRGVKEFLGIANYLENTVYG